MNNLFAFSGDRFLSLKGRDDVISSLEKKSNWEKKTYETNVSASEFIYSINTKEIFGSKNKIIIFDDIVPDPVEDIIETIQSLPKNRAVVFIFGKNTVKKIDKRTKFGKLIDSVVKDYPNIINDKGFVDQKNLNQAKSTIVELSKWEGTEECLDYIIEKSDYEYGAILSEIEKINTYLENPPSSIEQIEGIVCKNDLVQIDPIINKIKSKDLVGSLNLFQEILDSGYFRECYMMFLLSLLDSLNFIMYCNIAKKNGFTDVNDLSEFVSENYIKGKSKIPVQSIRGRYFYNKEYLDIWDIESLQFAIKKTEECIKVSILKSRTDRFIVENLLAQIS